ncbi:PH domain-containing protein [Planomicrobium chinense]|uniref:PH domain-containing protein n=1 Tax=Planococcus chinensis TaxID=272917 RepID=UPI001CC56A24|nr:PH domain-containing protein [Planococcus chinensis]MBZ5199729.1 PH domain-containing protein [Planococcus chinensis]
MMEAERQQFHFSWPLFQLVSLVKGSVFFIFYLFILKAGSDSAFILTLKGLFIASMVFSVIKIFLNWVYTRYEISETTVMLYLGIFVKKQRNVELKRIQNIQQTTNFLHRLLKLTSLTLETGTAGENAAIKFPVLSHAEADRIKGLVEEAKRVHAKPHNPEIEEEVPAAPPPLPERKVHFTAGTKDLVKAAFTSLSMFAIFPILFSLYFQFDDFFNLDETSQSVFAFFASRLWLLIPVIAIAILLSAIIGFITTYSKYGKFVISADHQRIYIRKGVFTETQFSIRKDKVQAIKIEQPVLKRFLGMAEVKLLSAGSIGDEDNEINSLFPFLPVKEAYRLVEELLPQHQISRSAQALPKNALWLRLLRPYYFWIAATIALAVFKMEWLWLSAPLFAIFIIARILEYRCTRYNITERFIQIRTGAFSTNTLLTKRVKIQEIQVTHSWLQRKFGVSSLHFHNRSKPLLVSELKDVPRETGAQFYHWFKDRTLFVK